MKTLKALILPVLFFMGLSYAPVSSATVELPPFPFDEWTKVSLHLFDNCHAIGNNSVPNSTGEFLSPEAIMKSCFSQSINLGLKPLCEHEKKAIDMEIKYVKENQWKKAYEVVKYLRGIESLKYDFLEEIYRQANEMEDEKRDLIEKVSDTKSDKTFTKISNSLERSFISLEFGHPTKALDTVVRTACPGQIALGKISYRTE